VTGRNIHRNQQHYGGTCFLPRLDIPFTGVATFCCLLNTLRRILFSGM
jgi:hypothetical protein